MYLHEPTGYLYLACSTTQGRTKWLPSVKYFDASKRSLTDRIGMLNTRGSGPIASRLKWLTTESFPGNNGDGTFNVVGVNFLADKSNTLRILLVNDRHSLDSMTGQLLDSSHLGANSTIEHFITKAGSTKMQYVRTHHPLINTPNSVAWVSDHSFISTNHRSGKLGFRAELDVFLGGGSLVYCDRNRCSIAYSGLKLPNGIARAKDGLIYVSEMMKRSILVFSLTPEKLLKKEYEIPIGLPVDNLSIDSDCTIFGAAIPKIAKWMESSIDPSINPPTTIFKISRKDGKGYGKSQKPYDGEYVVEKILEDDGSLLPGSTAAVHDPETRRVFLSGVISTFVAVCEMN